MRLPSENLRSSVSTFHSRSEGGFFCGLLKKTSYSILRRRSCDSRRFNSSSMVMSLPVLSLGEIEDRVEVTHGHERDRTKVRGRRVSRSGAAATDGAGSPPRAAFPLLGRHFLDHGDDQLAVAVVEIRGVAADLGEEAEFVIRKLGKSFRSVVVAGLGEEVRERKLHGSRDFREGVEGRHGMAVFDPRQVTAEKAGALFDVALRHAFL